VFTCGYLPLRTFGLLGVAHTQLIRHPARFHTGFLGVPRMSIGKLFLLFGPRPSIALLPSLALSETHLLLTTASRISSLSRLVQHFTRSQVVADLHELVG
jgi:hypothetical protein